MLCLKYKEKSFFCFKKSLLMSLIYSSAVTLILLGMDKLYSTSNEFFLFDITRRESYKVFFLILMLSMISKPKIRLSIISILLLFSFFQYMHYEYFGKNIGAIEFYLFFTNTHEVFETLNTMWNMAFVPISIVLVAFVLIYFIDVKFGSKVFKYKYGLHILLVGILLLISQLFYFANIKQDGFRHKDGKLIYPITNRHSARNFFVSMNYFIAGIMPKKFFSQTQTFQILEKPKLVMSDTNRTIILIIGESLRYDVFSLYDNKLTPKLQSLKTEPNFFAKKIYSGGTMTKVSVATLLNRLQYPSSLEQINNEDNCIFKLAKENHFGTYFVSAHDNKALEDMRDTMCPKYIDTMLSRDMFKNYIVPSGYDVDLKKILSKLNILNQNNFIVLEQRGSHAPYEKQYPAEFNKYTPYENTAFYTDYTLYDLIQYIKNNTLQEIFIFYVSDHGELLGEDGKNGHGHLEKNVYEIPFIMYTNSKNKETEKIFKNIRSHYDLSNYITLLLGYEVDLNMDEDREIYILNADLEGFSGYGKIRIIDNKEEQIEVLYN